MAHPILKIHSTSEFEKSFHKLPVRIQDLAAVGNLKAPLLLTKLTAGFSLTIDSKYPVW